MTIDSFLKTCSTTFKLYEHKVSFSNNKSNLWQFSTLYKDKNYFIYCAPNISEAHSLIKVARKKVPKKSRLVVVCYRHSDEDITKSVVGDYCLIDINKIREYGNSMVEARIRETMSANSN